jgi:glucose-6-phosphate isomerase
MSGFAINHTNTSGVEDTKVEAHIKRLSDYRSKLAEIADAGEYNQPESAICLPDDDDMLANVIRTVQSQTKNGSPEVVVVVGMGGSARGTKAVYDLVADNLSAKLIVIDTVSPTRNTKTVNTITDTVDDPSGFAICCVSKSGTTTETIANTSILIDRLADTFNRSDVLKRTVAVTDAGSQLERKADDLGLATVEVPEHVGGRFSVFSAVGLLPLLLAGVDIRKLRSGAKTVRTMALSGRVNTDPAAAVAAILFEHAQSARRIINHFFFSHRAHSLGDWSAQLFAESLGKSTNREGAPVYSGLYPTTTVGPDDLHSLFQLQLGGPKNFVSVIVRETDTDYGDLSAEITDDFLVSDLQHLTGRSLGEIRTALARATTEAFAEANRPFIEVAVPRLNQKRVGQFMLLEQLAVMYLGELMNINAFNQPRVENYKQTACSLLSQ